MTTLTVVLGRGLLPRWKAVCVIVACILAFLLMGVSGCQASAEGKAEAGIGHPPIKQIGC